MSSEKGFTLFEMAIVIIIAGILMIPAVKAYDTYLTEKKIRITKERLELIKSEIALYQAKYDRYPCPADREISINSTDFGYENCPAAEAIVAGACAGVNEGMCALSAGVGVDKNNDGDDDIAFVGAVPIMNLMDVETDAFRRIPTETAVDGWGNKFTYVVTRNLTNPTRSPANPDGTDPDWVFNDRFGVLSVKDEFYATGDPDEHNVGGTNNDAHYVIISHGPDGRGAVSAEGSRVSLCASGYFGTPDGLPSQEPTIPDGTAMTDVQNCNTIDTIFVSALINNEGDTPFHFDDRITFGYSSSSALWNNIYVPGVDPDGNPIMVKTENIQNLNAGNIGIGTGMTNPETDLDVNGSIRARTSFATPEICDRNGDNCFPTSAITGSPPIPTNPAQEPTTAGIACASGRVMKGISRAQEVCTEIELPGPGAWQSGTCPNNGANPTYVRGVTTDGRVICTSL